MKVPKKSLLFGGFVLALASSASAQLVVDTNEDLPVKRVKSVKHYTYDFENRRVVKGSTPEKAGALATFCYVNTDTSGFFYGGMAANAGDTNIDWGVLGGTTTTLCTGLAPVVQAFNFAYATSSRDTSVGGIGANLTLKFYTGYQGFGADSGNCPVATFAFTGLPGFSGASTGIGSGYLFTVDVHGGGEFCLPNGNFAFGQSSNEDASDTGTPDGLANTGPIMCFTGDGLGGAEPATGNIDVFDVWVPDTKGVSTGSFFFNGPPNNFTSWYLQVGRSDLSATPAVAAVLSSPCNKPGSLVASTPVLCSTWTMTALAPPGYLATQLFSFDTPFPPGVKLAGGTAALLCLDLSGSGDLISGLGGTTAAGATSGGCGIFQWNFNGANYPSNVNLCGFSLCVQGINFLGVSPFALTEAVGLTFGG